VRRGVTRHGAEHDPAAITLTTNTVRALLLQHRRGLAIVRPRRFLRVLDDESDNHVLECGLAGSVDAVVTGDRRMLKLGSYGDFRIRIVTIREFLES
jgi:predicted nucleic acid-binding protein